MRKVRCHNGSADIVEKFLVAVTKFSICAVINRLQFFKVFLGHPGFGGVHYILQSPEKPTGIGSIVPALAKGARAGHPPFPLFKDRKGNRRGGMGHPARAIRFSICLPLSDRQKIPRGISPSSTNLLMRPRK